MMSHEGKKDSKMIREETQANNNGRNDEGGNGEKQNREKEDNTQFTSVGRIKSTERGKYNHHCQQKEQNPSTGNDQEQQLQSPPERKRPRRGELFLDPKSVTLHCHDFKFEDLEKQYLEERKKERIEKNFGGEISSTSSSKRNHKDVIDHDGKVDDGGHQSINQSSCWETHYQQTSGNFFPVKNYVLQAFPCLLSLVNDETKEDEEKRSDPKEESEFCPDASLSDHEREAVVIMECGCGNGSAILPIVSYLQQQSNSINNGRASKKPKLQKSDEESNSTMERGDQEAKREEDALQSKDSQQQCLSSPQQICSVRSASDSQKKKELQKSGRSVTYFCFDISNTAVEILAQHDAAKVIQEAQQLFVFTHDITTGSSSSAANATNSHATTSSSIWRDFEMYNKKSLPFLFPSSSSSPSSCLTGVEKMNVHNNVSTNSVVTQNRLLQQLRDQASFSDSVDYLLLIFVLSAIPRSKMVHALRKLADCLKRRSRPKKIGKKDKMKNRDKVHEEAEVEQEEEAEFCGGGKILFRDYGALDHNYFRFIQNKNKVTPDGASFIKGDGTQQYFFEKEDVKELFWEAGLEECTPLEYHCNRVVNRGNGKEMKKVFVNGVFQRRLSPPPQPKLRQKL